MRAKKSAHNYFALQLSFLLFSMLLNCMGIVILKYAGSNISFQKLGILESFKDIPIALISLVAVNFINRIGTKKSILISLILVFICCVILPFVHEFWFFKIWFSLIGISFAVSKISVFAIIRNNANNEKELSKVMNRVEASFMIGMFCVNMGFGWLLSSQYEEYWKFGFWLIAFLTLITIWFLLKSDYSEATTKKKEDLIGIGKILNSRNLLFLFIIFLIVLFEQCFNSWLPTFYKQNLNVNSFYALQSTAFLSLFSFIGRYTTSKIIGNFSWFKYISFCLFLLVGLLFLAQFLVINVKENFWILLILFPILGLFFAPLYPLYNSKFIINVDSEKINLLVSLIVIVSSLGSSVGSLGMSYVFGFGLDRYFLVFTLIPISIIIAITFIFSKKLILRQ